jgi:dTDP-4-dehydrorhamnose 3,5-epimerase
VLKTAIVRAGQAEAADLPTGVEVHAIKEHADDRGAFREIFRQSWTAMAPPVQWNMVRSKAGVLRGVHAHVRHADYITMAMGQMLLGLHDPRPASPSFGRSILLRLEAGDPHLVAIPTGVCHGFYFPEPSMHVYGVSEGWDGSDEFGCAWNDPALGLAWPCETPLLSRRDRTAGPFAELCGELRRHGAI